jgi:nitrite reductase/ring-hydroxylating ferredoxin subunit
MRTEFVSVGPVSDHPPHDVQSYDVTGSGIAIASTAEGWFAVDDECTHRQCSLGQGDLVGTTLTCPCHLGTFDVRSGEVLGGPPSEALRTYPIDIVDGQILIGLPANLVEDQ